MATRYIWMGYGASLLNSQAYNQLPPGFTRQTVEKGPPFRKMIDPNWKPVVSLVGLDDPLEYTPIPTISQHRIVEMIKVTQYKDYFGGPCSVPTKNWFRRLFGGCDEEVVVSTDVDDVEPFVVYYRTRWVND